MTRVSGWVVVGQVVDTENEALLAVPAGGAEAISKARHADSTPVHQCRLRSARRPPQANQPGLC